MARHAQPPPLEIVAVLFLAPSESSPGIGLGLREGPMNMSSQGNAFSAAYLSVFSTLKTDIVAAAMQGEPTSNPKPNANPNLAHTAARLLMMGVTASIRPGLKKSPADPDPHPKSDPIRSKKSRSPTTYSNPNPNPFNATSVYENLSLFMQLPDSSLDPFPNPNPNANPTRNSNRANFVCASIRSIIQVTLTLTLPLKLSPSPYLFPYPEPQLEPQP